MKIDEIRERYLDFFKRKGHTVYPSDSLVPANDPSSRAPA
jgi:alanyl-tRNA synthetase